MIINLGECILPPNDANIPVDIWIKQRKEDSDWPNEAHDKKWNLHANNYMPRRGCCGGGDRCYDIYADTRKELEDIIKNQFLPLYVNAVNILNTMINNKKNNLYYWETIDS